MITLTVLHSVLLNIAGQNWDMLCEIVEIIKTPIQKFFLMGSYKN